MLAITLFKQMTPSYCLIEISKFCCSKFRGGGHAPLAHTLNLLLENICNINGFQSTIFKLLPGSCFKDLNGNYIESRNVCKVKFNGKAQTFLTVGNFRKCMVITLVIYFSRACSTKMEISNLSKNCKNCKKLQL